ncbi:MAG TPA: YceI family protein [Chryseolinea sp.]|nr:YceI family protein [Chryseolinea sp.]
MKLISLILLVWSFHHEEAKCRVNFSIYNAGFRVTGTVDSVRAIIHFDPSHLSESYIEARVNPSTINTGIGIRDKHLKRKDYFDVETYPLINLKSTRFKKVDRNKFMGDFELTIKGITRSVPITFMITMDNGHPRYKGTFSLKRLDFNLGEESMVLENNVVVEVSTD